MTTDDLKSYHGCKTRRELAHKSGFSEVTLWKWAKYGIPPKTQSHIQVETEGKLIAAKKKVPAAQYADLPAA